MKIVALSDSHGVLTYIERLRRDCEDAECIFHLGDYTSDAVKLKKIVSCPVISVRGNGDGCFCAPLELIENVGGVRIFAAHGHRYNIKYDMYALYAAAKSNECSLCLYGHTHIPNIEYYDGICFVNPGSVSRGRGSSGNTYAIIEIDKKQEVSPKIIKLM